MMSRAEGCNMAIASFIQIEGCANAIARWNSTTSEQERYELIQLYLAFDPPSLINMTGPDFRIELPESVGPGLTKLLLLEVKKIDY